MKLLILFTTISCLVWIGSGEDNELETNKLIQKICKIAKEKLHVHTYTPEDRLQILHTLKQKFLKVSKSHGYGSSEYMKQVVQGVSILLNEENYQKLCMGATTDVERRNIYRNLTLESANITVTDTISSNETAISNDASNTTTTIVENDGTTDKDVDSLFSNIDTLIEKTIEKSSTAKEEEKNVQNAKSEFLEDFNKSRKNEVNATQKLEKGVDKAIEKHMSLRRMFDDSNVSKIITDPVVQIAIETTKNMKTDESEKASDQDKSSMYSKIDTLIKKTVNNSPYDKQQENARNVKRRFLEGFKKVRGDKVDFAKRLETGVDKAIEKHISLRRVLDERNDNAQTVESAAEVKKPQPEETGLDKREIATDQDKASMYSKIDTLIKKTVNNSPYDKQQENVRNVKQKFLEGFKNVRGDEDDFAKRLEIGVDKAIEKHISLRRMLDERNDNAQTVKSVAEIKKTQPEKTGLVKPEIATDQDKARLYSKIETLVQKTIDSSSLDKQQENVQKIKERFLTDFRRSHSDETSFIQLLEDRFDSAINKHLNMRRNNDGPDITTPSTDAGLKNANESATDQDTVRLLLKIETLIQKTIDASPAEKQKENVDRIKLKFLEEFRKSHSKEIEFVQLLQNRFDNVINKHFKNPNLGEISAVPNQFKILTDDRHRLYSEIETLIKKSIDESPYKKQRENLQKVKRRFLEDYRFSPMIHMNQLKQMDKTFDDTIERYLGKHKSNEDPSAQIAEEALMDSGPNYNVVPKINVYSTTATPYYRGVTKEHTFRCSDVIENACNGLRELDKFTCNNSNFIISSNEVCDGHADCPDGSDERNCIQQVISKIHGATSIMSKLELNRYCLKSIIENSLLARQGNMLSGLLNSQVKFLQKYSAQAQEFRSTTTFKPFNDDLDSMGNYHHVNEINTIVNEVAVIVRSFGTTLAGALCTSDKEDALKRVDQLADGDIDQFVPLPHHTGKWNPFTCICDGAFCANVSCDTKCQLLCYQEHVLTEFNCKSVEKGQNSISLDLVCDGKVDCHDERDENKCPESAGLSLTATARFQGSKIFDKIIKKLSELALNREFEPGRTDMTNLGGCVQRLHKLSIAVMLDLKAFRVRRNQCFAILKDIFASIIAEVDVEEIQAKAYDALMTLKTELIEALRQTHFGNERIAPPNQCLCRGAECALIDCTQACVRQCFVIHKITQYPCPSSNDTIPVDELCNNKINCQQAEDEINCKQEVCRNYHAKMIRQRLKKILDSYKDAILGKVLEPWVNQASGELQELENSGSRLSPEILKAIIKQIVGNLASTYYSFETRLARNSRKNLEKFKIVATQVIETATLCTY